jgi:hypothetical protein
MKSPEPNHPWERLAAAARLAKDDRDTAAPYGFATRVAALGLAPRQPETSLFARFSLRALGVACLLMAAAFATNYSLIASVSASEDETATTDDPVAEVIDIAS